MERLPYVTIAISLIVLVGAFAYVYLNEPDEPHIVEPVDTFATYTGAEVLNLNAVTSSNSKTDDISSVFVGLSGSTMVFRVAELDNCIYSVIGYAGGDGHTKHLTVSEGGTVASSFVSSSTEAVETITEVEMTSQNDYSKTLETMGGISVEFPIKVIDFGIEVSTTRSDSWSNSETERYLEQTRTYQSYSKEIGNYLSESSGFSSTVDIKTTKGMDYAWAYTATAHVYEVINFGYEDNQLTIDSIEFLIFYDMSTLRDYVFETVSGEDFGFKYAKDQKNFILTDGQIRAALTEYSDRILDETFTVEYSVDGRICHTENVKFANCPRGFTPDNSMLVGKTFNGWLHDGESIDLDSFRILKNVVLEANLIDDEWNGYTKIYSADDLKEVYKNLGGSFVLMNDIDLKGEEWIPIGMDGSSRGGTFKGIFNGNGCTISDFTIAQGRSSGFFGVNSGSISNFTLSDVEMKRSGDYDGGISWGILAGRNWGTIEGCTVESSTITISSYANQKDQDVILGGLVGTNTIGVTIKGSAVSDVTIKGTLKGDDRGQEYNLHIGGLCGYMRGTIESCTASDITISGTIDSSWTGAGIIVGGYEPIQNFNLGGLVGYMSSSEGSHVLLTDCRSKVSESSITANSKIHGGNIWGTGSSGSNVDKNVGTVVGKRDSPGQGTIIVIDCEYVDGKAVGRGSTDGFVKV